jgi:protein-disulfide isomerase
MITQFFTLCFEMTRHTRLLGSAMILALAATACSKPEVSEGDAAAVAPSTAEASKDPRVAIADTARIMGDSAAKVWLVMASDFQCPACKHWHDNFAPEIMRDYVVTGKVRFAYTNFPIDHLHPHARAAAEAAMCAAAQGKFWGIHDRLFATQNEWAPAADPTPVFRRLATESGVETGAWDKCLADDVMLPIVAGDRARGAAGGVDQTPYFFIGERKVGGAVPASFLRQLLDSALALAGGSNR